MSLRAIAASTLVAAITVLSPKPLHADAAPLVLDREGLRLELHWGRFNPILARCDLVLAMAGTASEQAVGLGKPVARVRGQVMVIGSALAAISGVLFVVNSGFASANDYVVALTLNIWVMAVLGGLGNNRGAIIGGLALGVFQQTANFLVGGVFASVAVFAVFIIVLLAAPQGLFGSTSARRV